MAGMYFTPAKPVKRRLMFSAGPSVKRFRKNPTAVTRRMNKRTTKGPSKSGTLRQQVKSLQRIVKDLAPEIKYVDTSITITNLTTSGNVTHLTAVAQGDTQSTRTGNTINVRTLNWQLTARAADSANISSSLLFAIVMDREQVGDTAPAITDVFSSADPVVALPNLANLERFRFLYSSGVIDCQRIGVLSGSANTLNKTFKLSWSGSIKVSYNGTADTDIQKNGIYMLVLTDDAAGSIDFEGISRIGYTDV